MVTTRMRDDGAAWMAAMRRGDHEAAWAISDRVLARRDLASRDDPSLPYHQRFVWDGTPPAGRRVLVRCYHGLGDTIQFARALPALCAVAASVTLETQPELRTLLRQINGLRDILPFDPAHPAPPAELDIEIMELAHVLRLPPDATPPPYLQAPRTPTARGAIGVCWAAGDWDQHRSLPPAALAALLDIIRATGAPCLALRPGPAPAGFDNPQGCHADVAETASLIAGLRLVITVDSMVAHLAGALGVPCCVLLKHDADWRWGDDVSPWYPDLVPFRQRRAGRWDAVLRAVQQFVAVKMGGTGGMKPFLPAIYDE